MAGRYRAMEDNQKSFHTLTRTTATGSDGSYQQSSERCYAAAAERIDQIKSN